ncbi:MAG: hypothetical protein JO157_10825, partial [Acetobacteraceae bacterium]|nr:hypothetical protein [Acetobacteraceae bacterium]
MEDLTHLRAAVISAAVADHISGAHQHESVAAYILALVEADLAHKPSAWVEAHRHLAEPPGGGNTPMSQPITAPTAAPNAAHESHSPLPTPRCPTARRSKRQQREPTPARERILAVLLANPEGAPIGWLARPYINEISAADRDQILSDLAAEGKILRLPKSGRGAGAWRLLRAGETAPEPEAPQVPDPAPRADSDPDCRLPDADCLPSGVIPGSPEAVTRARAYIRTQLSGAPRVDRLTHARDNEGGIDARVVAGLTGLDMPAT